MLFQATVYDKKSPCFEYWQLPNLPSLRSAAIVRIKIPSGLQFHSVYLCAWNAVESIDLLVSISALFGLVSALSNDYRARRDL